jgi:DNA gyrase subunit A
MTTKEEDVIDQIVTTNSHDYMLFFTSQGRVFRLKAYEIPAASLTAKGVAAVNLLSLHPDEKITSIIKQSEAGDAGYLFMVTKKGTIKKTPLKDYVNIRTNGLITIKLDDKDELRWVKSTTGDNEIIISTSAGQAVRFKESDVRAMGRSAMGVRGMRLRPNDEIVGMDVVTEKGQKLLVMSRNGYGKVTKVDNFPTHKRGGVGIKAAAVTAKTGPIVTVHTIDPKAHEIVMISEQGQTIRVAIGEIPTLGRTTQGVRVMRLNDGDVVASLGIIPEADVEDDTTEGAVPGVSGAGKTTGSGAAGSASKPAAKSTKSAKSAK